MGPGAAAGKRDVHDAAGRRPAGCGQEHRGEALPANLHPPRPFVPPGGRLPEITLVERLRTREERRGVPRLPPLRAGDRGRGELRAGSRRRIWNGMDRLARHLALCNNLPSFAGHAPLRVGGERVGWLGADLARAMPGASAALRGDPDGGVSLDPALDTPAARSEALAGAARALSGAGRFRLRGEPFDVRATPEGPVLATLDRGAIAPFGILSRGVHVNGLVRRADGLHLWMGWRARDKAIAPGQMDNVVAGGVPAGMGFRDTLAKEAEEEASMPAALAGQARHAGVIGYVMRNDEGLRRDVLHCFDLELPEGFEPRPGDDEVERFELLPAARVLDAVRDGETVKFNVNLVLIDLFLREGLVADPDGALRAGLDGLR